ncbi:hypothetical protein, partial [Streptacidiphilus neutrinimicus]|uniref:hypothetical protein n=1 Tax=Streptacidiphilus neutrinimicus TaxID=105420 RepID=UPI0005A9ACB3
MAERVTVAGRAEVGVSVGLRAVVTARVEAGAAAAADAGWAVRSGVVAPASGPGLLGAARSAQ